MKNQSLLLAVACLTASNFSFAAASVNCKVNSVTGAIEATSPWRNALGVARADGICQSASVSLQQQPSIQAVPLVQQAPAYVAAPIQPLIVAPAAVTSSPQAVVPVVPAPVQVVAIAPVAVAQPQPAPRARAEPVEEIMPNSSLKALVPQAVQRAEAPRAGGSKSWDVQLTDVVLSNTFQRWATDAGWRIKWDAPKNILIAAPDRFAGTFEQAIQDALETPGIRTGKSPLEVCFYANTPPLARITLQGDQDEECK